jgi:hypothetical protein
MKKLTYITLAILILPLFLISCSNDYDGGIYTGNSMSTKKSEKAIEKGSIVKQSQEIQEEIINEPKPEKEISEEDYK